MAEPITELFGAPPVQRRPFWWVGVFALFAAFAGFALLGYFMPSEDGAKDDRTTDVMQLRSALIFDALPAPVAASTATSKKQALQGVEDAVRKDLGTSLEAARILAVASWEKSKAADPKALAKLAESRRQQDQALLSIYRDKKPSPQAKTAIPGRDGDFVSVLATIHAREIAGEKVDRAKALPAREMVTQLLMIGLFASFGLLGLGVLLVMLFLLAAKQVRAVGWPTGQLTPLQADALAGKMTLYLAAFFVMQLAIGAFMATNALDVPTGSALMLLLTLVAVIFVWKAQLHGENFPWSRLLGPVGKWPWYALVGFLTFCANIPIFAGLAIASRAAMSGLPQPSHPVQAEIAGAGPVGLAILFVTAAILAPLVEELTFRGMLAPAIARFSTPVIGILVSSMMFAMIHPQGPMLWLSLAAIGAGAAVSSYLTGSLVPAIVMHCIHNAFILMLGVSTFGWLLR